MRYNEVMFELANPPYRYVNVIYGLAVLSNPETIRYVGQSVDLKQRIHGHKQSTRLVNTPLYLWLRKYSDQDLIVYILEYVDEREDLDDAEIKWIALLDTYIKSNNQGLNCDEGGKGVNSYGYKHSQGTKNILSNTFKGENSRTAILTEEQVYMIRKKYFSSENLQSELAEEYGVSRSTIAGIIKRRKWKHLPMSLEEESYKGRISHKAKLSASDVLDIKKRLSLGETASSLSKEFSVSRATIYFIKSGETYKTVS